MRLALLAVFLSGCLWMLQDDYLYFPDGARREEILAAAERHGLVPWPAANDYRGLYREPAGRATATLILFHGNAGHAGHRAWYADELGRLGLRVILAEYPGYGSRPGVPSEKALVADAAATLAHARRQFQGPFVVAGESLGAGVAAALAVRSDAALLLITPWDKLENVARHHYRWLPTGLFLHDRYDSAASLAAFAGRAAVVVAENDRIVPARFGRTLFEALPEPKRLWVVPHAGHNDWPDSVDAKWWREVVTFLLAD